MFQPLSGTAARPLPRSPLTCVGFAGLWMVVLGVAAGDLYAQAEYEGERVVMTHQEPRHRVVLEDEELILMDVQIQPGDTTLYHTHDSAILYTQISSGQGPVGGRVWSVTSYVDEPFTHRVSNEGDHLFRIIALANFGGGIEDTSPAPEGIEAGPELENDWFRSYRLELAPGEETPIHRHGNPALVIQVTDGRIDVTRETDGFWSELKAMGDWAWRDADVPYRVRNTGSDSAMVVIHEARRTH